MRFYVASSWRCITQPAVVAMLRSYGHEVYDFRNPKPGDNGFHWSEIDGGWQSWNIEQYRTALASPIAEDGFKSDHEAMEWADACVLVLPCGRSAHLEAGWFAGKGKPVVVFTLDDHTEPELMYKEFGAPYIVKTPNELFDWVDRCSASSQSNKERDDAER